MTPLIAVNFVVSAADRKWRRSIRRGIGLLCQFIGSGFAPDPLTREATLRNAVAGTDQFEDAMRSEASSAMSLWG